MFGLDFRLDKNFVHRGSATCPAQILADATSGVVSHNCIASQTACRQHLSSDSLHLVEVEQQ